MNLTDEGRKRLKKLMLIQGVSQRELADAIGWASHSYLGRFIRGDVRSIDTEAAVRIAHHFGVGVDDLFVARSSNDGARVVQRQSRKVAA
jgi:transcriptional regulator with XRE-family HTH domain